MALAKCPDDVLLHIASHLYSNLHPETYCVDFEARGRIFGNLVLVCRRFHAVFTRLLYRTLCIAYENNNGPVEYESRWLQKCPHRRTMAALFRSLNSNPAYGYHTHFLEISWDEYDNSPEDYKRINDWIRMFPLLRELDIATLRQPRLCDPWKESQWALEFMYTNSFTHLRRLRITRSFSPKVLPQIFFLPNLQTLELSAFDARHIDCWSLPPEFIPRQSPITRFSLFAILTPRQLLQIMSWPAALQSFTYYHEGYAIRNAEPPVPTAFNVALQPFRPTLTNLKIHISDRYFTETHFLDDNLTLCRLLFNPKHFLSLQELQVPSFFLFGFPGKEYNRNILVDLLPSSLSNLDVYFGSHDYTVRWDPWSNTHTQDHIQTDAFLWLTALIQQCHEWGRLPALKKASFRQENTSRGIPLPPTLAQLSHHHAVQIVLTGEILYDEDWDSGWSAYHDQHNHTDADYPGGFGPVFGTAATEYSDSPQDSEADENFVEDSIWEDEAWQYFDEAVAAEKAKRGEKWVPGQWPDYEETREERDEIFRYALRGGI